MNWVAIAVAVLASLAAIRWGAVLFSPAHARLFSRRLDALTDVGVARDLPAVRMIVPGRNEEGMVARTVPSMAGQDYRDFKVYFVDDQSTDRTRSIVAGLRFAAKNLELVEGAQRPAGWVGKNWAVKQGVDAAIADGERERLVSPEGTGGVGAEDFLLFSDADVVFHPLAVKQAVRFAMGNGLDMLSMLPRLEVESVGERLGVGAMMTLLPMVFPIGRVNSEKYPNDMMASGAFILVRRRAYEAAGGHEAVKGEMIEDVNLGRRIKQAGARCRFVITDDLATTRMYEDFGDMWEGLTKNAYAAVNYNPLVFVAKLSLGLAFAVLVPGYAIAGAAMYWATPGPAATWAMIAGLAAWAVMTLVHARTVIYLRMWSGYAALLPASVGLYVVIAVASLLQYHFRGGNTWKGRKYGKAGGA